MLAGTSWRHLNAYFFGRAGVTSMAEWAASQDRVVENWFAGRPLKFVGGPTTAGGCPATPVRPRLQIGCSQQQQRVAASSSTWSTAQTPKSSDLQPRTCNQTGQASSQARTRPLVCTEAGVVFLLGGLQCADAPMAPGPVKSGEELCQWEVHVQCRVEEG